MSRTQATRRLLSDSILEYFNKIGHQALSVKITGRDGYVAKFGSRHEALAAGRAVLDHFAADPESGAHVSVAVFVTLEGHALLSVKAER